MSPWTGDERDRIADAQEVDIAPVRRNGELRRPTPIWVVRAGEDLYVRAAYGSSSGWYGRAPPKRRAHGPAGGAGRHGGGGGGGPSGPGGGGGPPRPHRPRPPWPGAPPAWD